MHSHPSAFVHTGALLEAIVGLLAAKSAMSKASSGTEAGGGEGGGGGGAAGPPALKKEGSCKPGRRSSSRLDKRVRWGRRVQHEAMEAKMLTLAINWNRLDVARSLLSHRAEGINNAQLIAQAVSWRFHGGSMAVSWRFFGGFMAVSRRRGSATRS